MKRVSILLTLFLALAGGALVGAQTDAQLCESKGGVWNTEEVCIIDIITDTHEIKHEYPLEVIGHDALEIAVDRFLQDERDSFLSLSLSDENFAIHEQDIFADAYNYHDRILSLRFSVRGNNYGTINYIYTQTFIYDIGADEMLSLKNLFEDTPKALVEIRQLAKAQLKSRLGEMLFVNELAPYPANYQSVVLSGESNALIFTFDTVTSTISGPQQVSIPLCEISDTLSDRVPVHCKE